MASINVKTPHSGNVTHEGGKAVCRTPKQELFLLSASFLNEPKFYETAGEQASRIDELAEKVAADGEWILNLVKWLRGDGGLRTSAQVVAAACVHARLKLGIDSGDGLNRKIISASIRRADEGPAVLAFYIDRYGRNVPKPVKRGVADALNRMNESQYLKYRGKGNRGSVSIADAVSIAHPVPKDDEHAALFAYTLNERHDGEKDDSKLPLIAARNAFEALPADVKKQMLLGMDAGDIESLKLTHEYVFSALGDSTDEEKLLMWEKLLPTMGYQACLMNTRRILELCGEGTVPIRLSPRYYHWFGYSVPTTDAAGDPHVKTPLESRVENLLLNRISNPGEAGYKVMPLSFLAAYRNVQKPAQNVLAASVSQTVENIPELGGRTLVLVDGSGSMDYSNSGHSSITPFDTACMFAAAIAYKSHAASVYRFNTSAERVDLTRFIEGRMSILDALDRFGTAQGGTNVITSTANAYKECIANGEEIDRVIVITDEQTSFGDSSWEGSLDDAVPTDVPLYVWNVGGYRPAIDMGKRNRMNLGGLTDSAFSLLAYAEKCGEGDTAEWPWETVSE